MLESPTWRSSSERPAGTVPLAPVMPSPQGHGQAEEVVASVVFAPQAPGSEGTDCPCTMLLPQPNG